MTALLSLPAWALTPDAVFEIAGASIVKVAVLDAKGAPVKQSSGVVVKPGEVITNCNAVSGEVAALVVFRGGKWALAQLLGTDKQLNLCHLRWRGDEEIGRPVKGVVPVESIRKGQVVYAVGAPQGMELGSSSSIVAGVGRHPERGAVIQLEAPVAQRASGGGLFDREGRLVGFTALVLKGDQILDFAVPASAAFDLVPGLRARRVIRAALSAKEDRIDQEHHGRLQKEAARLAEARRTLQDMRAKAEQDRLQAGVESRRAAEVQSEAERTRSDGATVEAPLGPVEIAEPAKPAANADRIHARLQAINAGVERALAGSRIAARMYSMDFSMALDAEGRVIQLVVDRTSGERTVDRTVTTQILKSAPYRDPARDAVDAPITLSLRVGWFYDHAGATAMIGALPAYGAPVASKGSGSEDTANAASSTRADDALRPDVDAERQARELAQEQLRRAEEQRELRRREEAERLIRDQEEERRASREMAEAEARMAFDAAANVQRVVAEFTGKVMTAISERFFIPPSASPDTRAEIAIRVLANGSVAWVRFQKSSGLPEFDRAIEQAVAKAQPLPVPDDARVYLEFRDQRMVFSGRP